ncbi:hypothetical protein [Achromobacter spanius]|uniref:hypothetical protein n=1 Tax=Achromobacter spanius TaxID=217203 RepID=UPI00067B93C2|nr:hypothetical protein [Achromobacter spanius]
MPNIDQVFKPMEKDLSVQQRPTYEFDFVCKPDPAPTVEVNAESLAAISLDVDDVLRPALRRFAERNPATTATVYLYGTQSVNFREPGWSEFLVVAGSEKVLTAVHAAFGAHREVKSRFSDYVCPRDGQARFHIEDGQLWQVLDAASWELIVEDGTDDSEAPRTREATTDEPEKLPQEDSDDEWGDDEAAEPVANTTLLRQGRLRAARSDASVGTIRQTIEEVFGLPAGSVALCGPDRRPLRADATIATLRRRWEDV